MVAVRHHASKSIRVSSGALCPLGGHRCVVAAAMRRIGGIALRHSLSHSRGPEAELSPVSCIPDECPRPRPGMITTRLRKGLREAQQTQKRVAAENPTAHVDAHRGLGKRMVRRYRSPRREALQGRGLARARVYRLGSRRKGVDHSERPRSCRMASSLESGGRDPTETDSTCALAARESSLS